MKTQSSKRLFPFRVIKKKQSQSLDEEVYTSTPGLKRSSTDHIKGTRSEEKLASNMNFIRFNRHMNQMKESVERMQLTETLIKKEEQELDEEYEELSRRLNQSQNSQRVLKDKASRTSQNSHYEVTPIKHSKFDDSNTNYDRMNSLKLNQKSRKALNKIQPSVSNSLSQSNSTLRSIISPKKLPLVSIEYLKLPNKEHKQMKHFDSENENQNQFPSFQNECDTWAHLQRQTNQVSIQIDKNVTPEQDRPRTRIGSGIADKFRLRQLKKYPKCIILPDDCWKVKWDIFLAAQAFLTTRIILFSGIFTPWRLAFYERRSIEWMLIEVFIDLVFILDLVFSFISAYYNQVEKLVDQRREIALAYLKSWFIIDLISVLPITFFSDSTFHKLGKLARLPRIFRIIKTSK